MHEFVQTVAVVGVAGVIAALLCAALAGWHRRRAALDVYDGEPTRGAAAAVHITPIDRHPEDAPWQR